MRVAVFCGEFPAISETFIVEEICQLLDNGNDVIIFSKKRGLNKLGHAKFHRYQLEALTIYLPSFTNSNIKGFIKSYFIDFHEIRKIPRLLNRISLKTFLSNPKLCLSFASNHNFDIVHCHFVVMGNKAVQLRKDKIISGKIVTTFHGSGLVTLKSKEGIYPELIKYGDLFISNSIFTTQVAVSKGYPKDKIFYIPAQFNKDKFRRTQPRFYPKDKITIISVGRLIPFKGFVYGVKAINRLIIMGYTNIEYRIIGEGPMRAEIEKEISKHNLKNYVNLLGQKDSEGVRTELENADIYIMPGIIDDNGRAEAQGVVLQEAQAMELPVIASRVGGMVQGIKDGESGFLVSQKDIIGLSEKIIWFLKNQEKIQEFGNNGRAFVEEHFNSNNSFNKLMACYNITLKK